MDSRRAGNDNPLMKRIKPALAFVFRFTLVLAMELAARRERKTKA